MSIFKKYKFELIMGIYFLIYFLWFIILEKYVVKFHVIHVPIDDKIPFVPIFIIPYFLWFLYVALALGFSYIKDKNECRKLFLNLSFGMSIFLIFSTLYPTGHLLRPSNLGNDIYSRMIGFLYKIDTPTNILPSIHTYNSIAAHIGICRTVKNKFIQVLSLILTILIIMATVTLKQHSIVDMVCGILLSGLGYLLFYKNNSRILNLL